MPKSRSKNKIKKRNGEKVQDEHMSPTIKQMWSNLTPEEKAGSTVVYGRLNADGTPSEEMKKLNAKMAAQGYTVVIVDDGDTYEIEKDE